MTGGDSSRKCLIGGNWTGNDTVCEKGACVHLCACVRACVCLHVYKHTLVYNQLVFKCVFIHVFSTCLHHDSSDVHFHV